MSRATRVAALAGGAAGTVAAGVLAGALNEKRRVRATRARARGHSLGSLRSSPRHVPTSDGIELYAEVDEPAEGVPAGAPTLVFVHGYALNLDSWHFQRTHFRGTSRLVFYDQRSHGRSERSIVGNASIDQLGDDLRAVLDELAPDGPVVLVGHSMGGMSVMAFAQQCPEQFASRVVGAALVSTTAGGLKPHKLLSPLLPDRLMSQLTPRLMAGLSRAPHLVDGARRAGSDLGYVVTGRYAFGREVPASYVEFVDEMLADTPFEVLAEFFPNFDRLDMFAVLEAFARVPTTIISGTKDLVTSVGHSRRMAELVPGARLVECEGAGHMAIMEAAPEVNQALDRLLDDVAGRA